MATNYGAVGYHLGSYAMKTDSAILQSTKLSARGKHAKLRRYLNSLKRSLRKATRWVASEPNNQTLWTNVRRTIEDFLLNEWKSGSLVGAKPNHAFFVRCDRTTMTQNDLDNGRLICLIGVALIRPAEFVIFRIGQWTADATR